MRKTNLLKVLGGITFLTLFILNSMMTIKSDQDSGLLSLATLKAWATADPGEGGGGSGEDPRYAQRIMESGYRTVVYYDESQGKWCTDYYPYQRFTCVGTGGELCSPGYYESAGYFTICN